MKINEVRIEIERPKNEVFEFTLEPENTPLWVDSVDKETVNTKQIGIGTQYTNKYRTLKITDYERDVFLELTNEKTQYQCSYSYRKIDDDTTELVYFECMLDGSDLEQSMDKKYFQKLKEILEK